MWARKTHESFWLDWILHYKSLKCLWDEDAKRQAGRTARDVALQELADLAKKINPDADISFVRARINGFRSCYRRERHRVKAARRKSCNYVPKLWCYKALDFLNDSSDVYDSKSSEENEEYKDETPNVQKPPALVENFSDCSNSDANSAYGTLNDGANSLISNNLVREFADNFNKKATTRRKSAHPQVTDSHGCSDFASFENKSDEYDILGKRIASHIRNMTTNQRLIAEKLITDVCIYGRMEKLTLDSTFYVDPTEAEQIIVKSQQEVDYDNPDTFIYTS